MRRNHVETPIIPPVVRHAKLINGEIEKSVSIIVVDDDEDDGCSEDNFSSDIEAGNSNGEVPIVRNRRNKTSSTSTTCAFHQQCKTTKNSTENHDSKRKNRFVCKISRRGGEGTVDPVATVTNIRTL
jgi:hypothetical protein